MIPLDISDEVVLRRTLEELESSVPILDASSITIPTVKDTATSDEVIAKLNELIGSLNLIIKTLDGRDRAS